MPKLIFKPGTPQAQEFELKQGKNFVGRGFANDFKLDDGSVSSSHALFEMNGSAVTITDLGSTNGTRVNGLPATGSPLQSGQVLKLGAIELIYMAETASAPPLGVGSAIPAAAAKQIATEFVIRDPSRVGVVPPMPPPAPTPVGGELRIPGAAPAAPPPPPPNLITTAPVPIPQPSGLNIPSAPAAPPPAPIMAAPTPIPQPSGMSIPSAAPSAPPPPPPAPIMATLAAEAPLAVGESRFSNIAHAPPPAPVAAARPAAATPPAPTAPAKLTQSSAGKTVCKFHRNDPAQWLCQKCNELFCQLCVEAKPTPSGVGYFCRACGTQCVAVRAKPAKKIEKMPQGGLETGVLLRTIGFGLGGAIVGAGIWTGIAALTHFDQPVVFAPLIGIACGFAVKTASQDRPGTFFSIAAATATLLGAVIGKIAAIMVTHHDFVFTALPLSLGILGLAVGMFAAWKVGGGDF